MTVKNVTQAFNKIEGDKWKVMDGAFELGLDIPKSQLEEIQSRSTTDTNKIYACAEYYVNYHPDASWEDLVRILYWKTEFAAARESKSFISTGNTVLCHASYILG